MERRLNGVLVARNYVMMDYDVSDAVVEQACAITPGLESPTVSPLARPGWHAVRAMVPRAEAQQIMDDLWTIGRAGDPGHRHRRMPHLVAGPHRAGRRRLRIASLLVATVASLLADRAGAGSPFRRTSGSCSRCRRCSRCWRPGPAGRVVVAVAASFVRADADGLQFRNGLRRHQVPWDRVHKIIFRPGDPWANCC